MQIIKLWLKLTTILAILGWATHAMNPKFAAWVDDFFHAEKVIKVIHTPLPEAPVVQTEKSESAAPLPYKMNE